MKLIRLISLFMVLLLTSCAGQLSHREASTYTKHLGSSTVALLHFDLEDRKQFVYCTGVWISQDEFLTAGHCIRGEARRIAKDSTPEDEEIIDLDPEGIAVHYTLENEVEGVGKEPSAIHLAKSIRVDMLHDLALVRTVGHAVPSHDVAEIATVSPAVGEKIHIVGHPSGSYWTYIEGTVSAYRDSLPYLKKVGPFLETNSSVYFGNSGGGAFDNDGKLVGICINLTRTPQINLFVHADTIRKFLTTEKPPIDILKE